MQSEKRIPITYIERCDKETEELLAVEDQSFITMPIQHLKTNLNEFVYIESPAFDEIRVDALSFEVDDVFRTYDVMLGLRLPKKQQQSIFKYLSEILIGDENKFDLIFDQADGLWNLNITLDCVEGFSEETTIESTVQLVYHLLKELVRTLKEKA